MAPTHAYIRAAPHVRSRDRLCCSQYLADSRSVRAEFVSTLRTRSRGKIWQFEDENENKTRGAHIELTK